MRSQEAIEISLTLPIYLFKDTNKLQKFVVGPTGFGDLSQKTLET